MFKSVDKFTKIFIITAVLIAIATPFVVNQYQNFNSQANPRLRTLGTITLNNVPHYGGQAQFSWVLTKKPKYPTLGVLCYQDNKLRFVYEGIPTVMYPSGSAGVTIANEVSGSGVIGTMDYTRPTSCTALVWDELSMGQQPIPLTGGISFTVTQ